MRIGNRIPCFFSTETNLAPIMKIIASFIDNIPHNHEQINYYPVYSD